MNERILAESEQYRIEAEYESVLLTVKESGRTVCIGDFYGDPAGALLDAYPASAVVRALPHGSHASDHWRRADRRPHSLSSV